MAGAGAKRVKSLEDQVERVSEEHTRQSEAWRALSFKVCLSLYIYTAFNVSSYIV